MPPRIKLRLNGLNYKYTKHTAGTCQASIRPTSIFQQQSFITPCSTPIRQFSKVSPLLKKGNKAAKAQARAAAAEEEDSSEATDPHDFSKLEEGIAKSLEKLQRDLSKLRTGGRFNPELLESTRVHVHKNSPETVRLGDLAQVIPKGGRSLALLVGEKDHIKPIISAIQGAKDLNLQPTQDPQNPNQLNVPIPPPTKESRDQAINAAHKAGEMATTGVRNARAQMQKRLRGMELNRAARPDDLKKAHKDMEKVVEKGISDVKKVVDGARKAMEQ